ncbi:MAG: Mu-like prophage major head subunit gpT family protein [Allorhizobium sp.]
MDINSSTLRAVFTALSTAYNMRFNAVQPMYSTVAMVVPSTSAMNEYPRLDDVQGFREWIGDRVIQDLGAQTYIVRNKPYEKTIGILRTQIEDDQIGIFTPVAAQMGQDAAQFPDQLVWPLFKTGETVKCYDGQYFFDTDHPGYNEAGQPISVSNFTDGAGPAWYLVDDTQVMKPLIFQDRKKFQLVSLTSPDDPNVFYQNKFVWGVDGRCAAAYGLWQLAYKSKATLNEANFEAARTAMSTIRRRDGSPLNIQGVKLIVPPALEGAAKRIVGAENLANGASNVWKNAATVVSVPYLA